MKIVHAADLHIDSPMVGIERYEGLPVQSLRSATREAFRHLVTLTLAENAAILLLSGDLFDDNWRDYATGLFFLNELNRLRETGARVMLVRGNHDAQSHVTRKLTWPSHVIELSEKKAETHVFEEHGVAIHGQSYATRETKDDLALKYPSAVAGLVNIGLLHTSLDGRPGHASYAPTSVSTLAAKGYDYWALGHVHAREVVSAAPYIVYPGNLQGRSIRETGAKGASVVTIEHGAIAAVEHRALDVLRWEVLRINATREEDADGALALVSRAMTDVARTLDGRLGVARVIVSAPEKLLGRLLASEESVVAEIRRLANDVADDSLAVERVVLKAARTTPLDASPARATSASSAVRNSLASASRGDSHENTAEQGHFEVGADRIARVRERLSELTARLPDASKELLALDQDDTIREITREAWALVERALTDDEP